LADVEVKPLGLEVQEYVWPLVKEANVFGNGKR